MELESRRKISISYSWIMASYRSTERLIRREQDWVSAYARISSSKWEDRSMLRARKGLVLSS
jgi:hypothetical protein